jgi:hypothetical protein
MLAITLFLFFAMVFLGSVFVFANLQLLKMHIPQIVIIILVFLAFLTPSNGTFFMGLEYEDAYIFTANSHFLFLNPDLYSTPLQTHACVFGSLSNCEIEATYGGHFIVLPSIAYFIHRILGYHPYAVCWINYVASFISVFLLYLLCIRLTEDRTNSLVAALVYATCPAMCLFHTSALAETVSSLFVLIYVFCFLSLLIYENNSQGIMRCLTWTLLGVSLCLALQRSGKTLCCYHCLCFLFWHSL